MSKSSKAAAAEKAIPVENIPLHREHLTILFRASKLYAGEQCHAIGCGLTEALQFTFRRACRSDRDTAVEIVPLCHRCRFAAATDKADNGTPWPDALNRVVGYEQADAFLHLQGVAPIEGYPVQRQGVKCVEVAE